jgi:hypothetical protein
VEQKECCATARDALAMMAEVAPLMDRVDAHLMPTLDAILSAGGERAEFWRAAVMLCLARDLMLIGVSEESLKSGICVIADSVKGCAHDDGNVP